MSAGECIVVKIIARDEYGNAHSSGKAITHVAIQPIASTAISGQHYPASQQHLIRNATNVECQVQDNNDGTYKITATVNIAGMYTLIINKTEQCSSINVTCGIPCPANFQLLQSNTYEFSISGSCKISMYDQFYNPCPVQGLLHRVIGNVVTHSTSFTINPFSHPSSFVTVSLPPTNVVSFFINVLARDTRHLQLTVRFDDEQLPFCPIQYTILRESFNDRFGKLRAYITGLYGTSHTPTFTVHRDNLLDSSMNMLMLNPHYFNQRFHVRFGAEPGVDAGGVAKYVNIQYECPFRAVFDCISIYIV